MRVGPYSIKLVTKRVDRRPIEQRHPWLQRWTIWKALAIILFVASALSIIATIMSWSGHLTSTIPTWGWAVMSLQIFGLPGALVQHKATLKYKADHPGEYYGIF